MTKQEEIREWINKYLTGQFICDSKELPDDECLNEAKEILTYLRSQGLVIKVERELPVCFGEFRTVKNQRESDYAIGFDDCKQAVRKAGYVAVESLIEE